jgi:hypothetical protein
LVLITLIGKAPFVDSDTLAIVRVDADVVDFRVCGIQDRACGNKTGSVSYAILGRRCCLG